MYYVLFNKVLKNIMKYKEHEPIKFIFSIILGILSKIWIQIVIKQSIMNCRNKLLINWFKS